ncbi:RnfABCDGE type electron transport complex subunit G [Candidatus Omnitrophota bacterium]
MKDLLRFTLVLFLVCMIASSILAGVYHVTKPKIEAQKRLIEKEALRQVMPESIGERFESVQDKREARYWKVFKDSEYRPKGYVFIAKRYGYSSVIETMVGIKSDGEITGVRILSHNETPGLGSKIVEVVSNRTILRALKRIFWGEKEAEEKDLPYFTEQLKGLNVRRVEVSKHGIEAITGATISSKAVVDSIKREGLRILDARE